MFVHAVGAAESAASEPFRAERLGWSVLTEVVIVYTVKLTPRKRGRITWIELPKIARDCSPSFVAGIDFQRRLDAWFDPLPENANPRGER